MACSRRTGKSSRAGGVYCTSTSVGVLPRAVHVDQDVDMIMVGFATRHKPEQTISQDFRAAGGLGGYRGGWVATAARVLIRPVAISVVGLIQNSTQYLLSFASRRTSPRHLIRRSIRHCAHCSASEDHLGANTSTCNHINGHHSTLTTKTFSNTAQRQLCTYGTTITS